jgi:hypothetical protein
MKLEFKTKRFLVRNQDNFTYILMILICVSFLTIFYLVD